MEENKPLNLQTTEESTTEENSTYTHQSFTKKTKIKEKLTILIKYFTKQLKEEDQAMEALENVLENEPLPQKRKKMIISSCLIIVFLMGLVYYQNSKDSPQTTEPQFQAPTISPIESDAIIETSEFSLESLQIPLEIHSTNGETISNLDFKIPEKANQLFQIKLMKTSDSTPLYESTLLKAGETLPQMNLNEKLLTGSHQILFQITTFDKESKKQTETKTCSISVVVENKK